MEFNKLFFTLRQWPCHLAKSIAIDFNAKSVEVSSAGNTLVLSCGSGEFSRLTEALQKCGLESWSSMDAPVLDGTVWSLELYSGNRRISFCQGIDRFPPRWEEFMKIVAPGFRKLREF